MPAAVVAAYVRDVETGGFRVARCTRLNEATLGLDSMVADVPREVAETIPEGPEPPVHHPEVLVEQIPEELGR